MRKPALPRVLRTASTTAEARRRPWRALMSTFASLSTLASADAGAAAPAPARDACRATCVLVAHGENEWGRERLAGWADVGLSSAGRDAAAAVAARLKERGLRPDFASCARLRRSRETRDAILESLEDGPPEWTPGAAAPGAGVEREAFGPTPALRDCASALNDKHEGMLTGLERHRAAAQFGSAQLDDWLGHVRPPPIHESHPWAAFVRPAWGGDGAAPLAESFDDVADRARACGGRADSTGHPRGGRGGVASLGLSSSRPAAPPRLVPLDYPARGPRRRRDRPLGLSSSRSAAPPRLFPQTVQLATSLRT